MVASFLSRFLHTAQNFRTFGTSGPLKSDENNVIKFDLTFCIVYCIVYKQLKLAAEELMQELHEEYNRKAEARE